MSKIWQPLDPEFVHKLAPEYVEFHKAHLIHRPRADQLPWSASIRDQPAVLGSSDPLPVASIKDYSVRLYCSRKLFSLLTMFPE